MVQNNQRNFVMKSFFAGEAAALDVIYFKYVTDVSDFKSELIMEFTIEPFAIVSWKVLHHKTFCEFSNRFWKVNLNKKYATFKVIAQLLKNGFDCEDKLIDSS